MRVIALSEASVGTAEMVGGKAAGLGELDGTDVETPLPAPRAGDGVLRGVGAASGRVTGSARVVHDPATAEDPGPGRAADVAILPSLPAGL